MSTGTVNIETGDVVELKVNEQWHTAIVLLATDEAVIVDLCDGSTPLVARAEELGEVRVFTA